MRTCLRKIEMLAATLATAASVSLALLFTACPNNAGGNTGGGTPASVSYRITFRVDGGHGTLKATAEGIAETDKSPITVEKDKTVTFTAKPEAGYKVDKWTVTPAAALQEGGTAGNPTAKVKITANTKVNVSFTNDLYKVTLESLDSAKKDAVIKAVSEITGRSLEEAKTLVESAPQVFKEDVTAVEADEIIAKIAEAGGTASKSRKTYPVIFSVEGTPANGTLKAEVDGTVIHTTNEVEYDKTVIFTAAPAADYEVGKWKITGGTFEAGTGTDGKLIAKVKITAATTVNVSFTLKTYPVTFSVKGTPANGTLKAEIAGTEIHTNDKAEHGKTVTFTAKPATGYKVDTWTITGGTFEEGGTLESTTAKVKITAATTVNVSFTKNGYTVTFDAKGGTPKPPAQTVKYKEKATKPWLEPTKEGHTFEGWYNKAGNALWDFENEVTQNTELYAKWRINTYPVTFSVKGTPPNGTLKAEVAGTVIVSGDPVEYGKIVTFTAVPESGYKVDTWTITPASALQEGGTTESPTAKVKIAADTEVNVSFIQAIYAIVPFGENGINLRNHLRTATPHTDGIYYIKVTGLKAEDLYGCVDSFRAHASTLGEVLKNNPTKKVALKLGEIHGLTDMSWCFFMCEKLIQVHEIPKGVKYMEGCFSGCTNLTQVSEIPSSVTNMAHCFSGCKITQAPVIPNGVTDMSYCFSGCRSLTQAPDIPSSVTDMNNCFHNCASLTQAPVIPNSVTDMSYCFDSCRSLIQAPVISEGVIDMSGCFWACTNLSQAPVIPKTVRYMISCFESCEKITTVTLKCPYNPIQISNPNLWSGQKYAFENAFKNCKGLGYGSIKVPADQLKRYRFYASTIMGAESSWFIAE